MNQSKNKPIKKQSWLLSTDSYTHTMYMKPLDGRCLNIYTFNSHFVGLMAKVHIIHPQVDVQNIKTLVEGQIRKKLGCLQIRVYWKVSESLDRRWNCWHMMAVGIQSEELLSSFFSGVQQEPTLLKTRSLLLLMRVPNHIPLFESLHIPSA